MKVLKQLDVNNVVFIDIETVSVVPQLEKGTPLYDSWLYKMKYKQDELENLDALFIKEAALHAEFSKIVCITIGKIKDDKLKMKSYSGDDEKEILTNFCNDLTNIIASNKATVLCGHTIVGFDIPFIMRRCMITQVEPPSLIDVAALKPWEVTAIDLATLWKGSGFNGASLMNIAVAMGLKSPKDEMYNYETSEIYHNEKGGLTRITRYCEDDVFTTANIFRICRFEKPLERTSAPIETEKVGALERIYNTKKVTKAEEGVLVTQLGTMSAEDAKVATDILKVVMPKKAKA